MDTGVKIIFPSSRKEDSIGESIVSRDIVLIFALKFFFRITSAKECNELSLVLLSSISYMCSL